MGKTERIDAQPIRSLLRQASPSKAEELDGLFDELAPICELDREEERILFQSVAGTPNVIRIGTKCTVRLQIQAYAAGVVTTALGTPGFANMSKDEREKLLSPANQLFTWSVGRDLQQWLKPREGVGRQLDDILDGAAAELPEELIASLNESQMLLGRGLFRLALAWILLHEIGHLKYGHTHDEGFVSIQQENEADRFAAEWMIDAASDSAGDVQANRLNVLFGVSVALLWLTVFNIFLGQKSTGGHPQAYDRLFQVLDQIIDQDKGEPEMVWQFVSLLLFNHMWAAGFNFDEDDAVHMQGDPRDEVNHLINRIAAQDLK